MMDVKKRGGRGPVGLRSLIALFMSLAVIVAVGCDDDDDTTGGGGPNTPAYRDLTVNLNEMDPVANQRLQFRALNANNSVVAVAILDTLRSGDTSFTMPNALPTGAHRLEVYADTNLNSVYDVPPADLAWRTDIPPSGTVDFTYDTVYTDIGTAYTEPGDSLVLTLTGFANAFGQLMEVRVADSTTGQTVGLYRTAAIGFDAFNVTLPGIYQSGRAYQVDIFTDANANGIYDDPPTDNAWRTWIASTDTTGATLFMYNTDFTDVEF